MHQDHGQSPDVCRSAIDLGFSSVMMDGSLEADGKTIASYDYNVDVTKKVVDMAHARGVTVEGELGCLGSLETMRGDKEDGHGTEATMTREQLLTDPEQAADFVKRTQLDALAIAIGTSHGAYKFTRKPTGDILAIDRIKEIHRRIPNTHLVMHGSSSVPQDLLAEIRKYGGSLKETYGVPVEEIQEAIKHGVRKINIDTDIRLAMTAAIRRYMAENPEKFDPRDYLKPAREAAKAICKQRYLQFGCEGQAAKIAAAAADERSPSATRRASWRRRWSEARSAHLPWAIGSPAVREPRSRSLPLVARGKVRDNYAVGDDRLLMVASDRLSAFDVVMAEPIPGKGRVLTQMALFWFERLEHIVPNHLTGDDPRERGRRRRARAGARPLDAGAGGSSRCRSRPWCAATSPAAAGRNTRQSGAVCGVMLPPGLKMASKLPAPIFTPATKAAMGDHDENIDFARMSDIIGADLAAQGARHRDPPLHRGGRVRADQGHHRRRHQVRVRPRRAGHADPDGRGADAPTRRASGRRRATSRAATRPATTSSSCATGSRPCASTASPGTRRRRRRALPPEVIARTASATTRRWRRSRAERAHGRGRRVRGGAPTPPQNIAMLSLRR